jgi:hypothetical protein
VGKVRFSSCSNSTVKPPGSAIKILRALFAWRERGLHVHFAWRGRGGGRAREPHGPCWGDAMK